MSPKTHSFRLIIVVFSVCAMCYGMAGILLEDGGIALAWSGVMHGQWHACLHSLSVMMGCVGLLLALLLAVDWPMVWAAPHRFLLWMQRAMSQFFFPEQEHDAVAMHASTDHPHLDSPLGEKTLHFAKGSFQANSDGGRGSAGGGGRRPSPLNGNSEAGSSTPNPTSTDMRPPGGRR